MFLSDTDSLFTFLPFPLAFKETYKKTAKMSKQAKIYSQTKKNILKEWIFILKKM